MLKAVAQPFPIPAGYTGQVQPYVLGSSAIPFVGLSTGSVSAAGAISGITALPAVYANAYCWFPANALATAIAAGWYYCTFSTLTAGTAFLNTYTSGTPSIPSSPTAVTDGKGAFTGDTGEEFSQTITVPTNALGPNGTLRISTLWSVTNNANVKTGRIRYSGNAGAIYSNFTLASQNILREMSWVQNRASASSQIGSDPNSAVVNGGFTLLGGGAVYQKSAVDTTAATTLVLSGQRATATDNLVIESYLIELLYGA